MPGNSLYVFIDESGNFDFSSNGSRYFVLNATLTDDPVQGAEQLLQWRHHILTCDNSVLKVKRARDCTHFHCTEDAQYTRDGVFKVIAGLNFESHGVILQKNKTHPTIQTPHDLYQRAFSGLLKGIVRRKGNSRRFQVFAAQLRLKPKKSPILAALKAALASERSLQYQFHFIRRSRTICCKLVTNLLGDCSKMGKGR